MPIVADATVFRYLVIVDATAILPALFGTVLVPPAVVRELQHARPPECVLGGGRCPRGCISRPRTCLPIQRCTP